MQYRTSPQGRPRWPGPGHTREQMLSVAKGPARTQRAAVEAHRAAADSSTCVTGRSAGYDLPQLLVGRATLEVITAVRLRLVAAARVPDRLRLAHPLAGKHPVYVLLEAGELESLAAAVGRLGDVAVADDTARRAALWRYREALNQAVNARGVPRKLDVSVPISAMAAFADAAGAAVEELGGRAVLWWGHLGDGNLHVNVLALDPAGILNPA